MKTPYTPPSEFESTDQLVPILVELGLDIEVGEQLSGPHYLFIHPSESDSGHFVRFCKKGRIQPNTWGSYDTIAGTAWPLEVEQLTPLDLVPELCDYEPDPDFLPYPSPLEAGEATSIKLPST